MPRYKLTIAYDGTDFCGWQKQFPHEESVPTAPRMDCEHAALGEPEPAAPDDEGRPRVELRTVQSVVERTVRHVVREPVVLTGASRTDAGVHARGQVAAFTCSDTGGREGGWPVARGTEPLILALNSRLPGDVLVSAAEVVPDDFNPIRHATSKAYTYTIWTARERPLWDRRTVLHIWQPLDAAAMDAAARLFEGEHDFAAFAAAGHGRATTVRKVFECRVARRDKNKIVMAISGNGFLWNMVRIIAGTLVEIGKGRMTQEQIREALNAGDRAKAGPTLPPQGLCLEQVDHR